jgi:hypothetical protein
MRVVQALYWLNDALEDNRDGFESVEDRFFPTPFTAVKLSGI